MYLKWIDETLQYFWKGTPRVMLMAITLSPVGKRQEYRVPLTHVVVVRISNIH
jgi:hypothetical protein